jgi:hypothetical protein
MAMSARVSTVSTGLFAEIPYCNREQKTLQMRGMLRWLAATERGSTESMPSPAVLREDESDRSASSYLTWGAQHSANHAEIALTL